MADSVDELIVKDIQTRLLAVPAFLSVERWRQHGNSFADLPAVVISIEGHDLAEEQETGREVWILAVDVEIRIDHDETVNPESTDELFGPLYTELHKAIMADPRFGEKAIKTNIVGRSKFQVLGEQQYAGQTVELQIVYRHKRGDPTVQFP